MPRAGAGCGWNLSGCVLSTAAEAGGVRTRGLGAVPTPPAVTPFHSGLVVPVATHPPLPRPGTEGDTGVSPCPPPHSRAGPDTPARRPGAVFAELHTGDRRGAGQRGHLLHFPAEGPSAPRHQGPALARGECGRARGAGADPRGSLPGSPARRALVLLPQGSGPHLAPPQPSPQFTALLSV